MSDTLLSPHTYITASASFRRAYVTYIWTFGHVESNLCKVGCTYSL